MRNGASCWWTLWNIHPSIRLDRFKGLTHGRYRLYLLLAAEIPRRAYNYLMYIYTHIIPLSESKTGGAAENETKTF